jgi:CubicO group peptidase (beta-lactamase class C family)
MSTFKQYVARTRTFTVLLMAAFVPTCAKVGPDAEIDHYVRAEMARRQIPGLSLLVAREHRVVLSANYGVANLELDAPVTDGTSFEIASMTKQFTDAAILLLAERGKLALTDRLSKYFSDLPPAWQSITIQQLMNHTAGLRDDWNEDDSFFYSKTTPKEFFEALKAAPLTFAPGTNWSYGCGPFVLGLLIQRVTGKPYAQFMRESIFQPLGMTSTDINDPAPIVPNRAAGYVIRDGVLRNGVRISPVAEARADVGIRTTTHDLARWDAALDGTLLLSATSRELMFTPGQLNNGEPIPSGLGWFIMPFRGHTEIFHDGAFRTGFGSVIARYPDDRLTVIVLANLQRTRAYSIARGVASFYNTDYRPIPMMEPRRDSDSSRTMTAARVMAALREGRTPVDLVPGASRLSPLSLGELREELAHASPINFVDCHDLHGKNVNVFHTAIVANCFYRTDGERRRFWTFSFTADGRVAYLELEE